ncbi:energy-coupling factor ABC transporter ATP-binding protein [Archaeoglobus fulgidus]|uniref:Putative ABC transporter ATP-binding protein AF_1841 n=1 Tax=Archaeoglobus fulgidus (strain ATCC 49558 / DSM 4304 / JCM 9628 / NBRC 100126 / VC-16) TaxID=224325 RepID=Y1841_ARCFU|nr:energy-coupling factor ABC transporter ATP-binding protein [Archaeoglobus fulgidus]O28437.1 RecName: Full=Putative ABC transporter ATP-binding protein AF_1841 [Archaeoglobus fulgidus DSM 4304]AAB89412.1 cobalt transport ATP-binding protein (cbiO-2) [Archaeoglobus fulgidus DSM 4304]
MGDNLKVIEADSVSYDYPDGSAGVREVSLEIFEGDRVGLIGANGSGKSTLILLLAGLLRPTKGKIRIFGREIDKKNVEEIRRKIGVVFQNPDDFLFNPTVRDELLYVPRQLEWSEEEMENAVKEYAEMFGITHLLNKPPFRLSGGEKKKVEIASVLIYKPEVLLLDEPTAYVDGKTKRLILKILEDFKGTLVIATHELDVAEKLADKFVLLNLEHRIEAAGGKEILKNEELLEKAGVI